MKSKGLNGELKRQSINYDLVADILDDSEYLEINVISPDFNSVDFYFSLNNRGRDMNGSIEFGEHQNSLLRYPKIENVGEMYKLREVVDEVKDYSPYDIELEYKYYKKSRSRRDRPTGALSVTHAESLFKDGKDIYPHIHIDNKNSNTKREKYKFAEWFSRFSEEVGSRLERFNKEGDV